MAVRTDVTFDFNSSPRIITVADTSTEISVQDLVDTIRNEEALPQNLGFDKLLNATGKDDLGDGVFVGITASLRNAKLAFQARGGPSFVQCEVSGGNLGAVDANGDAIEPIQTTAYTQVLRTSAASATLTDQEEINKKIRQTNLLTKLAL